MEAEYFATVSKGKIVALNWSNPPHTLLENQIPLTAEEYYILKAVRVDDTNILLRARMAISEVETKVKEVWGE